MATEGIERLTIDAIAQRSGVARSTIYRRWPDRAELLAAAFESVAGVTAQDETLPLAALIHHKAAALARDFNERAWGRAIPSIVAAAAHDDTVRQALVRFRNARLRDWLSAIERAAARGELADPPVDPVIAIDRFIAGFFMRHLISFEPLDDAFQAQQVSFLLRDLGVSTNHSSS